MKAGTCLSGLSSSYSKLPRFNLGVSILLNLPDSKHISKVLASEHYSQVNSAPLIPHNGEYIAAQVQEAELYSHQSKTYSSNVFVY